MLKKQNDWTLCKELMRLESFCILDKYRKSVCVMLTVKRWSLVNGLSCYFICHCLSSTNIMSGISSLLSGLTLRKSLSGYVMWFSCLQETCWNYLWKIQIRGKDIMGIILKHLNTTEWYIIQWEIRLRAWRLRVNNQATLWKIH